MSIKPIAKGESRKFEAVVRIDGVKLSKSQLDLADDLIFVAKKDISVADGAPGTILKKRTTGGITTFNWVADSDPNVVITIERDDTRDLETGLFHLGFAFIENPTTAGLGTLQSKKGIFAEVTVNESQVSVL